MTVLTTRQRDILSLLLESDDPLIASDMADQLQLTQRQVNYGLKGIKAWLAERDVILKATPGVGAELICSSEESQTLAQELALINQFQLVLTVEQRRQLISLALLDAGEPIILYQLQQWTHLSRTTILKDLDAIEEWLNMVSLRLDRRPNYGFQITGTEQSKRHALVALLWGQTSLGEPITKMSYAAGLTFEMAKDADLLPLVKMALSTINKWDTKRTFGYVAYAEAQQGGRFTDDSVRYLTLVFAIQAERILAGNTIKDVDSEVLSWLQRLDLWTTVSDIAKRLGRQFDSNWPTPEIARIAMYILAAPRNERWPDDLETDQAFRELIDELMHYLVDAYDLPSLARDKALRDGLVAHIVPACFRRRFDIWIPTSLAETELPARFAFERAISSEIAKIINQRMAVTLPDNEVNNIALMLRAAYIRERPHKVHEVIVICPSGMATAQLLVARLEARFPRLGTFRVLSLRELNQEVAKSAELIITTVPLPNNSNVNQSNVIEVHPLLLPEDVESLTRWLT